LKITILMARATGPTSRCAARNNQFAEWLGSKEFSMLARVTGCGVGLRATHGSQLER
jgi:hypothetical protein